MRDDVGAFYRLILWHITVNLTPTRRSAALRTL